MRSMQILLAADADACVRYAAEKLKEYIFKATKIELKISETPEGEHCFSVGKSALLSDEEYTRAIESVEGDGFTLFTRDGNVYIAAKTSRGVMYGAYDYIEKFLGVRFLTAEAEYVPVAILTTDFKPYVSNPDFSMRTYLIGDTFQEHADLDHLARTRVLDLFTDVDEAHGGGAVAYGRNCNHNFHYYVPFEVYGNQHPEFYRFLYINAEIYPTIDLTNGITDDGKLDESMDVSVAKIVIEEMKKDLEAFPKAKVFCFTQEDGPYYFDDEHNRALEKKYKRSGILIRFCNVIVRELNAYLKRIGSRRIIKLMTFAYSYAKDAPVTVREDGQIIPIDETVKADENIIIQLALFKNGYYGYFSEKQYEYIERAFREWRAIANEFWFWGYDSNFHRYLAYYDSLYHISEDVRGFKERNISYLCINGPYETRRIWHNNIRAYVFRKCMWDTSLSDRELCEEYVSLYYKAAADSVREILQAFHRRFEESEAAGKVVTCETFGENEKSGAYSADWLYALVKLVEKGETAIREAHYGESEEQELLRRMAEIKCTPLSLLYDNYYFFYPDATDEEYEAIRDRFFSTAREAKLDYFAENWTVEQYAGEDATSVKVVKKHIMDNGMELNK